ncbi:hypothetical protein VNI00_008940 [Paramarasmius palmivorus]|uniref:Polyketide synthase n=1 Tax=Paramarasmius palmivorus TaxID=297713 RepID=A0AAW0CSC3_9AGAR
MTSHPVTSPSRVLISGVTGYVASHVAQKALDSGYLVRGTVRSQTKADGIKELFSVYGDKFETAIVPDITTEDLSDALQGVSAVIHIASPVIFGPVSDPKAQLFDPAVEGTLNVLRAAQRAGVSRIILTSSLAAVLNKDIGGPWVDRTYGPDDWNSITLEEALGGNLHPVELYACSKILQEKAAWTFVEQHPEMQLTTVIPPMLVGPVIQPLTSLDALNDTAVPIADMIRKGVLYPDALPYYSDVRDAATAHIVALTKDTVVGKRLLVGKERGSIWKAAKVITEQRPELVRAGRLPSLPPADPTANLPVCTLDTSIADRELDIKFRSFEESVLDMVDHLLLVEEKLKGGNCCTIAVVIFPVNAVDLRDLPESRISRPLETLVFQLRATSYSAHQYISMYQKQSKSVHTPDHSSYPVTSMNSEARKEGRRNGGRLGDSMRGMGPEKIAIVGIACDLPSGTYSDGNLAFQEFFNFLQDRGQAYEDIPPDRLNIETWHGSGLGHINVRKGSFLKGIDTFDNLEFGISQTDAQLMAPVTRKLIETCFLALLDSGIDYRARNVGCYTSGNSFDLTSVSDPDEYVAASFAGYPSMVANRVSYHLDLLGPSLPTDTACSSTMSALHLAVQALHAEDCEAAVVAGCQLNHRFMDWIQYTQGGILSPDGKCKPFDASANGFSRGEGCVAIIIKPLNAALRDSDHIYGTILATAINNSGSAAPAGAPVAERQRDAMIDAYRRANVDPKDVDYIELHATGTAKGDPTEANWVGQHFKRDGDIVVGSVKGNLGHTEIASLLTSLAKVLHIFQHKTIPPNVNLVTLNPAIHWEEYRLRVPMDSVPLRTHLDRPSLISMASSGIGGANGHVILEGPPKSLTSDQCTKSSSPTLILASGLSPRTTLAVSQHITEALAKNPVDRTSLATILGRRAKQMTWRTFTIVSSDGSPVTFPSPVLSPRTARPIVFLFSGQGPQHKDMGRELFSAFPAFRRSVEEMDRVHQHLTGTSLIDDYGLFTGDPKTPENWPVSLILPSITIFQLALYDLLSSLGIRPDIVIGHSAGETAVLHACGSATKAMAVELSIIRGQTFTSVEHLGGTMAALSCSAREAQSLIDLALVSASNEVVEIACYNSPTDTAIAGHRSAVELVVKAAQEQGILARIIRTQVPIHSSMMEACRAEYSRRLEDLFRRYPDPHLPKIKTYSTLTGEQFIDAFDAEYFWKNTRGQVHFTRAMQSLSELGPLTIIEIAPHPVLMSYTSAMVDHSSVVLQSVRRPRNGQPLTEYVNVLELCGQLTINGHNCVDFNVLNGGPSLCARHTLPAYPFIKRHFALYPDTPGVARQFEARNGPLNCRYLKVNKETHPILAEHVIRGQSIMPAAGFIEMALEFGATALMNVEMRSILSLSSEKPVPVQVIAEGCYWKVVSLSPSLSHNARSKSYNKKTERLHADGYMSFEEPQTAEAIDICAIHARCSNEISGEDFYSSLVHAEFGLPFRRLVNLRYCPVNGEALSTIQGLDNTLSGNNLQFIYAYLKVTLWNPDFISQDITISDGFGVPLMTLKGFKIDKHRLSPPVNPSRAFEVAWKPVEDHLTSEKQLFKTDSVFYTYSAGAEAQLQGQLNELDTACALDVWILSQHGDDGNTCLGLLRAVQREFPLWMFHVVLFPVSFTLDASLRHLKALPQSLSEEPELFITESGDTLVSRLEVVGRVDTTREENPRKPRDPGHTLIRVDAQITAGQSTVFVGNSSSEHSVIGFSPETIQGDYAVAPYIIADVPLRLIPVIRKSLPTIPGLLIAIMALGPGALRSLDFIRSLSILLTHADTVIGRSIAHTCSKYGIPLTKACENIRLSELCALGRHRFDLVVSGYEEPNHIQLMSTLLKLDRGRCFLWNGQDTRQAIFHEPGLVQEALKMLVSHVNDGDLPEMEHYDINSHAQVTATKVRRQYHPHRAYLVLGGIGSLGLQIALYLYQNGARHIILTSRSGYNTITRSANISLKKIVHYLRSFEDLDIQFVAVNGSSQAEMRKLVQSLSIPVAGCFILSAVLADAPFQNIPQHSFSQSHNAKTGVLRTLMETIDVHQLDFLVAFSSVSGTIGNQGQANYAAANTAMEGLIDTIPNGISFICPGILDSSLMLGTGAAEKNRALRSVIPWSISAEDMIVWLDDAIQLLLSGQKVSRYVPDLDWDTAERVHGLPRLARHLAAAPETEDPLTSLPDDRFEAVRNIIQKTLKIPREDFQDDIPLTSYGLDSLSASRISVLLRQYLVLTQIQLLADISAKDIFRRMSDTLADSGTETEQNITEKTVSASIWDSPVAVLERLFDELQDDLCATGAKPLVTSLETVLVTGSTGAVGNDVVFQLLSNPKVKRIYALNRKVSGTSLDSRQALAFSTYGFSPALVNSPKLVLLEGDLSLPQFGLQCSQYDDLSRHLTHIIHAAWKINFMAPLSEFSDLLAGITNLLRMCARLGASLTFISTIAVYFGANVSGAAPEEPIPDPTSVELTGGYMQSKWIAERLVQLSYEKLGVHGNVLRLGLISGSSNGAWNSHHWFPALVQSGAYVGCLPDGHGTASWIPLDLAATAIIECYSRQKETIHIIHPSPTSWSIVVSAIAKSMNIPVVPLDEWLARVEHLSRMESSSSTREYEKMAALPLLDYYREGPKYVSRYEQPESLGLLPVVACGKMQILSSDCRSIEKDVDSWIRYWKGSGFLSV